MASLSDMITVFQGTYEKLPYYQVILSWIVYNCIVDTEVFKVLYNDQAVASFLANKEPLDLVRLLEISDFMGLIEETEPALYVDYERIAYQIEFLRDGYRSIRPDPFEFARKLVQLHANYMHAVALFVSYDVYMHIMKTYYTESGSDAFRQLFPINADFTSELEQLTDVKLREMEQTWQDRRIAAEKALWELVEAKDADELLDFYHFAEKKTMDLELEIEAWDEYDDREFEAQAEELRKENEEIDSEEEAIVFGMANFDL